MTIVKNFCSYNPYKYAVILVKKPFYCLNTSTTEMYNCIGILRKIYIFIASHMDVQHHSLFVRTARCPESVYAISRSEKFLETSRGSRSCLQNDSLDNY